MSTYELIVIGFALPRYVCARVRKPAKWTCVSWGVFVYEGEFAMYSWPYMNLSIVMPFLWEVRIREWSVVPTVMVWEPWILALMMSRL